MVGSSDLIKFTRSVRNDLDLERTNVVPRGVLSPGGARRLNIETAEMLWSVGDSGWLTRVTDIHKTDILYLFSHGVRLDAK